MKHIFLMLAALLSFTAVSARMKISYDESKVLSEDIHALGGVATRKEVAVYFDDSEKSYMVLLMYVPNEKKGPVPAFLGVNFMGNHATTYDPGVSMPIIISSRL